VHSRAALGRLIVLICVVVTALSLTAVALKHSARGSAPAAAEPEASTVADATADAERPGPTGRAGQTAQATPATSGTGIPVPAQRKPAPPAPPRDPASLGVLVNKDNALDPVDYTPRGLVEVDGEPLRKEAAAALRRLQAAGAKAGYRLVARSGYRSAAYQRRLHARYAAESGEAAADRKSARAGHSEHQTGLAVDVTSSTSPELTRAFGATAAGRWMAAHAQDYGFVLRFPEGQEDVTGYIWEPWHLRYLGPELTRNFARSGAGTLEEYYGRD